MQSLIPHNMKKDLLQSRRTRILTLRAFGFRKVRERGETGFINKNYPHWKLGADGMAMLYDND